MEEFTSGRTTMNMGGWECIECNGDTIICGPDPDCVMVKRAMKGGDDGEWKLVGCYCLGIFHNGRYVQIRPIAPKKCCGSSRDKVLGKIEKLERRLERLRSQL